MDILGYLEETADFFLFWKTVGFAKFLRFFWYFFIFEFPRYVLLDAVGCLLAGLDRRLSRGRYRQAREALRRENPLVTVLVPGKNEGENIGRLARSLREQTYRNLEIIIVDDGSDDQTPVICRSLQRAGIIHRYLRNEVRGGKASAANFGLTYAQGRFIVHVDADCSFDRDAIERVVVPFYLDPRIGAVAGNIKVRNAGRNLCTALQAVEYLKNISVGRRVASTLGILRTISGAFGAFRAEVLDRFGGWDTGPGLDGDITMKVRKSGFRVVFEPAAIGFTSVPERFGGLTRQRLRWNRSLVRFRMRKHRSVFLPDQNFSFLNFFTSMENIFFNVFLDVKWFVYVCDIAVNMPALAKYIIPANFVLYFASNLFQMAVALAVSERAREEFRLCLFLPLMPFYTGIYMRFVRTLSYVQELFLHSSYKDPWNPAKVSRQARRKGL